MEEQNNRGVGGIVAFLLWGLWRFCWWNCGVFVVGIVVAAMQYKHSPYDYQ